MRRDFEKHQPAAVGWIAQKARKLTLLGCLALLAACGSSARSDFDLNTGEARGPDADAAMATFAAEGRAQLEASEKTWRYRIEGGDQLEIVFFTHPDQNRFVTVRPDGFVTLPYLGDVQAEDRTPEELSKQLQDAYSEVLVSPRVDVIVQKMGARFYVLGAVTTPGEFEYERKIDLLQALARAGGYTGEARLSNIVLLRRGYGDQKSFAAVLNLRDYLDSENRDTDISVRPYDIVWVPRSTLSKWDNATQQALRGMILSADMVLKGWSLVKFDEVFARRNF